MILLDTNVLSEPMPADGNPVVADRLDLQVGGVPVIDTWNLVPWG
jgi:hypothetical protein